MGDRRYSLKVQRQIKRSFFSEFKCGWGNSLAVQWLGLYSFTAKGLSSTFGQGTKIPQANAR